MYNSPGLYFKSGILPNPILGIANCEVYQNYSDTSVTNIFQVSNSVYQVANPAAVLNYTVQVSGAAQPATNIVTMNGYNAVDFDGSSDFLQTLSTTFNPSVTGISVYITLQFDTVGSPSILSFTDGGGLGRDFLSLDNSYVSCRVGGVLRSATSTPQVTANTKRFLCMTLDLSGNLVLTQGNSSQTITSVTAESNTGNINIGSNKFPSSYTNGRIAEVAVYSRSLSTTESNLIKAYWNQRYALGL